MDAKKPEKARHVMVRLRAMQIDDVISFPIDWLDTVRTQSSKCNLLYGGKRNTYICREDRTINVKRTE